MRTIVVKGTIDEREGKVFTVTRTDEDDLYESKRSALIPEAIRYANKIVGFEYNGDPGDDREAWCAQWNNAYFRKMDELARDAGLHL